jgi:hypothetical protein
MKQIFDTKSMVLGAILGAIITFSVAAGTPVPRTAWEYKVISGRLGKSAHPPLSEQLDQAASGGWEIAGTGSDDGYPFVILRKAK